MLCLLAVMVYPSMALALGDGVDVGYMCTSVLLVLPLIGCIAFITHRWLFILITCLFTLFSLANLTMVNLYGEYLMPGTIYSLVHTNTLEASEYARSNLRELLHWLPLLTLSALACVLFRPIPRTRYRWLVLALTWALTSGYVAYKMHVSYHGNYNFRFYSAKYIWTRPPYNIVYRSIQLRQAVRQRDQVMAAQHLSFGAQRCEAPEHKEVYVLAIGESLRYSNLSLNGLYPRTTTPKLENRTNLVLFDDYYSQACLTIYSLPLLLTRATPTSYDLHYQERSIVEPFRECGFATYVVTIEWKLLGIEPYLTYGVDSLIRIPCIETGDSILYGDEAIVHVMDSLVAQHNKLFLILQFYGNHRSYSNYQPSFARYTPSWDGGEEGSYEEVINAYDNTILYTDHILSSVIDVMNRPQTVSSLLFVSDHGELISEEGSGHGGSFAPIPDEYHVPMIWWYSPDYATTYPDKVAHGLAHRRSKINGDNVFYTLCDMAAITLDSAYAMPQWSIFSSTYTDHPRYVLLLDGESVYAAD